MTLLALRMFLGGALSKLWAFLKSLSFWQIVTIACLIFAIVQHFELVSARSSAARWHKQYDSEHSAREADRAAYRKAQDEAKAKNDAQIIRVKAEQEKISEDVASKYERDLARLRAGNVRHNATPSGPASGPGPSGPGNPSAGPDGEVVPLPGPELLRAQEIELQLNALIDWVSGQTQVDPNK